MRQATCHLPRRPLWPWSKGSAWDPRNGRATLLALNSEPDSGVHPEPHSLCSLARLGLSQVKWLLGKGVEFPDPLGLSPVSVCVRVCVYMHTHTHTLMEVNKLQTSVLKGHAQIVCTLGQVSLLTAL